MDGRVGAIAEAEPISGVGVLRYPAGDMAARQYAEDLAKTIRVGATLVLPSSRDRRGNFYWDFRIEGGDPGQVRVVRTDDDASAPCPECMSDPANDGRDVLSCPHGKGFGA